MVLELTFTILAVGLDVYAVSVESCVDYMANELTTITEDFAAKSIQFIVFELTFLDIAIIGIIFPALLTFIISVGNTDFPPDTVHLEFVLFSPSELSLSNVDTFS